MRSNLLRREIGSVRAVDGISFSIAPGQTMGLVGESGCGKSTTARMLVNLIQPTAGKIFFRGDEITHRDRKSNLAVTRGIQMVFQDPYTSLNRRKTIRDIVAEPLRVHDMARGPALRRSVVELLSMVGLGEEAMAKYPHEFSGGQRQRIGIARALALSPQLLILDEPVSALDVSIQGQVVNLLQDLQDRLGLSYLFVAHDLSVLEHMCDTIGVMYLGRLVEVGTRDEIYDNPQHPYTKALLSAVPIPDPGGRDQSRRIVLTGDVPSPANPPSGCHFRTRCWKAQDVCATSAPVLESRGEQPVRCHFPLAQDVTQTTSA